MAGRREFVAYARSRELPAKRACELAKVSRRRLRHPRYGYRRLHVMLVREGRKVNVKRVRRLCVVHGLKLKRKRPRKRRGIGNATPVRAEHADHVWAYAFVHDVCRDGRKLKILTVEDEYTRQCLAIEVGHRMSAAFVCRMLLQLFATRGRPAYVRSDNGPEFIAKALMKMLAQAKVEVKHIEPGSPWQNGRNERFNGTLRDERLNLETFEHRDQGRAVCRLFGRHYNTERPHSSLGYRTPAEFAAAERREEGRSVTRPAGEQRTSKTIL